jgi:phage gpG-like protein
MIYMKCVLPELAKRFKQHHKDIMLVLAATMQTNRAMMFDKDGADNGKKKWAPLKFRKGRPLQDSGTLRKSMAPQNDGIRPGQGSDGIMKIAGNEVTIGTSIAYAGMMNDGTAKMPGGVLRPVNAQALKIPMPTGKRATKSAKGVIKAEGKFMFRKSVKIPARPMNEVTEKDKKEWAETLTAFIAEFMSGRAD